jgi:hypothetical protein
LKVAIHEDDLGDDNDAEKSIDFRDHEISRQLVSSKSNLTRNNKNIGGGLLPVSVTDDL